MQFAVVDKSPVNATLVNVSRSWSLSEEQISFAVDIVVKNKSNMV